MDCALAFMLGFGVGKVCILILVGFHFGGKFHTLSDGYVTYVGANLGESMIEMDKVSYFEIKGHLHDHYPATNSILRMFWVRPGQLLDLKNGLVMLVDDQSCQLMLESRCNIQRYMCMWRRLLLSSMQMIREFGPVMMQLMKKIMHMMMQLSYGPP